jgi:DNA-damage-inducible protein D
LGESAARSLVGPHVGWASRFVRMTFNIASGTARDVACLGVVLERIDYLATCSAPLTICGTSIRSRPKVSMSDIFHFDPDRPSFEDLSIPNGVRTWLADDLGEHLGYQVGGSGFNNALIRAQQALLSIGLKTEDHFIPYEGSYKLTRFACYLVTLNGDPKKPGVAAAQAYFAQVADSLQTQLEKAEGVERVLIRDEVTSGIKSLSSTAKRHGVQRYDIFLNKGYLGMYNMSIAELTRLKGAPQGKLLDHMGKAELAANLFRVTQTDAKIKNESIRGQSRLEDAAFSVGRMVRKSMREISGTTPEALPISRNVGDVKKNLKVASKEMKLFDSKPSSKKRRKKN